MEHLNTDEFKPVKKRPVGLLVIIAIACIGLSVGMVFLQRKNTFIDYNYTLVITAKGMNLVCPYEVIDGVRMDSVVAKFDKQLWEYFTLLNVDSENITDEDYCQKYEDSIVKELRKNATMREFSDHDVTLFIDLQDKNGVHMCTLDLPASKYSGSGK